MEKRLAAGQYYITQDIFIADLRRMFANCRYAHKYIYFYILVDILTYYSYFNLHCVQHFLFLSFVGRTYNAPETVYYKCAEQLDKYIDELFNLPPAKKRPVD